MITIYNAKARRAGGHITINAKDAGGVAVKVTGVDEIDFSQNPPVATDKDGGKWALAIV